MPEQVTDPPATAGDDSITDAVAREARALADPTRLRVFRLLVDAAQPLDVATLVAAVGVHHSVVRDHLGRLTDAGLVESATSHTGRRGRPPRRYAPTRVALERWAGNEAFRLLSSVLAEALRLGLTPVESGRRAGRRLARTAHHDVVGQIEVEAARLGFRPRLEPRPDGLDIVLQTCPLAEVARDDPEAVCEVHLGLAQGMAGRLGGMVVTGLDAHDPVTAGCRLHLEPVD